MAVLTLALGIGATTTLFTVVDRVLVRPLPWADSDRLVRVEERRDGRPSRMPWTIGNGTYHAWLEASSALENLGVWRSGLQTLRDAGEPVRIEVVNTTPSILAMLGSAPLLGRGFSNDDALPGSAAVALLSFGLWQERFGADTSVVGRTVRLENRAYEIVGVMPRNFAFPDRQARVWVPFRPPPLTSGPGRPMFVLGVSAIAKLRPGVSLSAAAAEGSARAAAAPDIRQAALSLFGSAGTPSIVLAPVLDVTTAQIRPALIVLVASVCLLFIASAASVASVQLARAMSRRNESAVREAIGARRSHLVRGWLAESLLLATAAGVLGVTIAWGATRALPALVPPDFPRIEDVQLDAWSVLAGFGLTVVVGSVCGFVPLLAPTAARGHLSGQAGVSISSPSPWATRLRNGIVIWQVAVTCVLLVGGALLARSLIAMIQVDRGYDPSNLLTARLTFPHDTPAFRRVEVLEALQERLAALPGVERVGFGNGLPLLQPGNALGRVIPDPRNPGATMRVATTWRVVSPGYVDALSLRLVDGRMLASLDTADGPGAMVVNRAFAAAYLGSRPVGQRLEITIAGRSDWEVVGVVADAISGAPTERAGPEFLVSYRQAASAVAEDPVLLIRTTGGAVPAASSLRAMVRAVDAALVLDSVASMTQRVSTSLAGARAVTLVVAGLATLALVIAGAGLFGVLAFTTARRAREIGLRMALGAQRRSIVELVAGQALRLAGIGLLVGLGTTVLGVRLLSSLVFGVSVHDVVSFAVAPIVIGAVAVLACIVPARRALSVDAIQSLRTF